MKIEQEIQRFKMELLRKMPFYGDVLMHLVFVEDKRVPTAATDGKTIWYNPDFLSRMKPGERNFVLMHEVFHRNRRVVKKVYMGMDDNKILGFIRQNKYALGLDDANLSGSNNKWLAMWE